MSLIRDYVQSHLIDPFKNYNTVIQDTIVELIIQMLEELYNLTLLFPEILSPDHNRLDILRVIADQFLFNIRDEAKLEEQANILSNILYVYNRRGSIDTIENMWKYYGGDLPKEVEVAIPSYNIFRYSVSPFSRLDVFQDGETNRTGIYEIKLINSTYPIPKLREFLLEELVAAGSFIYFTNVLNLDLTHSNSHYLYEILEAGLPELNLVTDILLENMLYCTSKQESIFLESDLYVEIDDGRWDPIREKEYFILADSLLGESLGYEFIEGESYYE